MVGRKREEKRGPFSNLAVGGGGAGGPCHVWVAATDPLIQMAAVLLYPSPPPPSSSSSSSLLVSRGTPQLVRLATNKSSGSFSSSSLSSIIAVRRRRDGVYSIVSCLTSSPSSSSNTPFKPSTKLFVSGLSFRTTKESLENAFKDYGQLLEVNLVMDKIANRPRGFAFLRYAKEEESRKAIEGMHGKFLDGRVIFVEVAKAKSELRQSFKDNSRQ